MNRITLLLAIVLLSVPGLPMSAATHDVPHPDNPGVPTLDPSPPVQTGIAPLDNSQADVVAEANSNLVAAGAILDAARSKLNPRVLPGPDFITFFHDDHSGGRFSGFGNWSTLQGGWDLQTNLSAITTAGASLGQYAGGQDAILVFPEVDLKTGLADRDTANGYETATEVDRQGDQALHRYLPEPADRNLPVVGSPHVPFVDDRNVPAERVTSILGFSAMYRFLVQHSNYLLNDEAADRQNGVTVPWIGLGPDVDAEPRDGLYTLDIDRRFNLAKNRDDVSILIFTQRPTEALAATCVRAGPDRNNTLLSLSIWNDVGAQRNPICTIVAPMRAEPQVWTGSSGWTQQSVDLTRWAGGSVWVGLRFTSGGVGGPAYFQSRALFDQQAGFYGFQLGNVTVTGLAPAQSVRVREFMQPAFIPDGWPRPVIGLGQPLEISADVVNLGSRAVNVSLRVEVEDRDQGTQLRSLVLGSVRLEPGAIHPVRLSLTDLTAHPIPLRIRLAAPAATGLTPVSEADPLDDFRTLDMDVADVLVVHTGDLQRGRATLPKGDVATFTLDIANGGTAPLTVFANASVIHAGTRAPTTALAFAATTPAHQVFKIPVGKTVTALWQLDGRESGQYFLFVTVNDERPFEPADLLPISLQPMRVPELGPYPEPVIDGLIEDDEWPAAGIRLVEYADAYGTASSGDRFGPSSGTFRAASDGDTLWLSASVANANANQSAEWFRFYLDTGGNQSILVSNNTYAVNETFGSIAHIEAAIPLRNQSGGLQLPLGAPVRVLLAFREQNAGNTFKGIKTFPAGAIVDGEGFTPPDGSLRDEMDSWYLLRLPNDNAGQPARSTRLVSLGFGVDRSPPAYFELDLDACTDLQGWSQTGIYNAGATPGTFDLNSTKWNCAPYGTDARIRAYHGRSPNSTCEGTPCQPWSTVTSAGWNLVNSVDYLVTPAIAVGAIETPTLAIRHQYSTLATIQNDYAARVDVNADYRARAYVQELDPTTGTWSTPILLRPEAGYSTDLSNNVRAAEQLPYNVKPSEPGWWWPTGWLGRATPHNDTIPIGRAFSGSPTVVDRIPLYGFEHGAAGQDALFLTNKTIRLLFGFHPTNAGPTTTGQFVTDWGWRIDGMSLSESPRFGRDLSVTALTIQPGFYDPASLSVGPGALMKVNVTVVNEGTDAVSGADVCLRLRDLGTAGDERQSACDGPTAANHTRARLGAALAPGESRNVTMTISALGVGAAQRLVAGAVPDAGDDFPIDNMVRDSRILVVQERADVKVLLDASKTVGAVGEAFPYRLALQNMGNVPITGMNVTAKIRYEDGPLAGQYVGQPRSWITTTALPVGAVRLLSELVPGVGLTDLTFAAPLKSGRFSVGAVIRHPLDLDASNDAAALGLQTTDVLFGHSFDTASALTGLPVSGTPQLWSIDQGSLLVGGNAEMPANADGSILLTGASGPLDLRGARGAVLTLRHRYELEAAPGSGYDAARVEVSTDGGQHWRLLQANPNPSVGLPEGYTDLPLAGNSALAVATAGRTGEAFTGLSSDLPGAQAGWIESSFDLQRDPELSRATLLEAFRLDAFPRDAPAAPREVLPGQFEFGNLLWALDEPNALNRLRAWTIDNPTYTQPQPHTGNTLWWSGTAGRNLVADPPENVKNYLNYTFTVPAAGSPGLQSQLLLSWWDWRSGQADGGTGALYDPHLLQAIINETGVTRMVRLAIAPIQLQSQPDGWIQYAFPVEQLTGAKLEIRWAFDAFGTPGFDQPRVASNRGWFVDDVELVSYAGDRRHGIRYNPQILAGFGGDADSLESEAWKTAAVVGADPMVWTRASPPYLPQPVGWHVENVSVPGKGDVAGWRFSSPDAQGYPHLADSRLTTPLIDLTRATGKVSLAFDHQYWFESKNQCPLSGTPLPNECFRSAIDAGAVEYQVYDPATSSFGPWRQFGALFDEFPRRQLFGAATADVTAQCNGPGDHTNPPWVPGCVDHNRTVDRRTASWYQPFEWTGYTALEVRSPKWLVEHDYFGSILTQNYLPASHGTSFQKFPAYVQYGWQATTANPLTQSDVSYVLSGASPGQAGWSAANWDVSPLAGQQVRFGFHAVTNPGQDFLPTEGNQPGWSLANVRIESTKFEGKPVQLRLRAATDESLGFGEWRIDTARLVGPLAQRNAAVFSNDGPHFDVGRGATANLTGRVATLGTQPLANLVLVATVVDDDLQQRLSNSRVRISVLGATALPNPTAIASSAHAAFQLPVLQLSGIDASQIAVEIDLPSNRDTNVTVAWSLWSSQGAGFVPATLDDSANILSQWTIRSRDVRMLSFTSTIADRTGALAAIPAAPLPNMPVHVSVRASNDGNLPLIAPAVTWTMAEVVKKGNPATQDNVGKEVLAGTVSNLGTLATLTPQGSVDLNRSFTPTKAGLYRITLKVQSGGDSWSTSLEILVGMPATFAGFNFADGLNGWSDLSKTPSTDGGGGTPLPLRFRAADNGFLWGVNDTAFGRSDTYCSGHTQCLAPVASGRASQPPSAPPAYTGLEGIARGPAIALDRVPEGHALITMSSFNGFEGGDGARLEAIPYRGPYDALAPRAAFKCQNGDAMAFILMPSPVEGYSERVQSKPALSLPGFDGQPSRPGQTVAPRLTALAPVSTLPAQVLGSAAPGVTVFDLGQPARSICPGEDGLFRDVILVNYTIQPQLRVGTMPGYVAQAQSERRGGSRGLLVYSMTASALGMDVWPSVATWSVQPGAPKTFAARINNSGSVDEQFELRLADSASSTAKDWITLPTAPLSIAPGQSALAPIRVAVPNGIGVRPGLYDVPVVVRAIHDNSIATTIYARIEVRDMTLPDLVVRISVDAGAQFIAGTSESLHFTVQNVGALASRPVQLALDAISTDGAITSLGVLDVPALCPPANLVEIGGCGGPQLATASLQWILPLTPARFTVRAQVDPIGSLMESVRSNNNATMDVDVTAFLRPDLAVTRLEVLGAPAGIAEEGQIITLVAELTNQGTAPATDVRFRMRFGSSEPVPPLSAASLAPGQTMRLEAVMTATRGQFVIWAGADSTGVDLNSENDQQQVLLRVRGHEIELHAPSGEPVIVPGSFADVPLEMTNHVDTVERVITTMGPGFAGWTILVSPNPVSLAKGQGVNVTMRLGAPLGAAAGLHNIPIVVTPVGGPASQAVTLQLPVRVTAAPSAPLLNVTPVNATPGPATVAIHLVGTSNAAQSVLMSILEPSWNATSVTVLMQPGNTSRSEIPFRIGSATPVGNHTMTVVARNEQGVELVRALTTVTVLPKPVFEFGWQQPQRYSGDLGSRAAEFPLRISNTGNAPAQATVVLRELENALVHAAIETGWLLPGQDEVVRLRLERGADDRDEWAGRAEIWLKPANGSAPNPVAELDLPPLNAAPDLLVESVEYSPRFNIRAGKPVTVEISVQNAGAVDALASMLHIFANGLLAQVLDVPAILAGGQVEVNTTLTFNRGGEFLLSVQADAQDAIQEVADDDNAVSLVISVAKATGADRILTVPGPGMAVALLVLLGIAITLRRRKQA